MYLRKDKNTPTGRILDIKVIKRELVRYVYQGDNVYTIWASHSGTQQPLVDATEQAINEAECQIELLHFRKVFVDDHGNPVAEDMLRENERIARLINKYRGQVLK